jgi:CBS domain containing-hemolysin-like protein
MEGQIALWAILSALIILGNAFFVATEYALVGARRVRIEALAKKGNPNARRLMRALNNLGRTVAGIQVAITMFSIAVGLVIEPFVESLFGGKSSSLDPRVGAALSFLVATYLLVVIGELMPKYISLNDPDRIGLFVVGPLLVLVTVLKPLVWIAQRSAMVFLKPLGIHMESIGTESVEKEELMLLVRAGTDEGMIEKSQADVVTRALRIDTLSADDIMVHRLDVQWLDIQLGKDEVLARLAEITHSRMPVCRGDIDDMVGIAYLHDIVKHLDDDPFNLENVIRPVIAIPENLTLDKIILRMREAKTQMLVVCDEYGGTSGIITLEDVVEEVFGELEDDLESERPPIETYPSGRISARGEVRFDELASYLEIDLGFEPSTDTLAEIVMNDLERVPNVGDKVETELGTLRVENMARQRITRVALRLKQ